MKFFSEQEKKILVNELEQKKISERRDAESESHYMESLRHILSNSYAIFEGIAKEIPELYTTIGKEPHYFGKRDGLLSKKINGYYLYRDLYIDVNGNIMSAVHKWGTDRLTVSNPKLDILKFHHLAFAGISEDNKLTLRTRDWSSIDVLLLNSTFRVSTRKEKDNEGDCYWLISLYLENKLDDNQIAESIKEYFLSKIRR